MSYIIRSTASTPAHSGRQGKFANSITYNTRRRGCLSLKLSRDWLPTAAYKTRGRIRVNHSSIRLRWPLNLSSKESNEVMNTPTKALQQVNKPVTPQPKEHSALHIMLSLGLS